MKIPIIRRIFGVSLYAYIENGVSTRSRETSSVVFSVCPPFALIRQIYKHNFAKQKMTLIVLLPIMFANRRKPLSHKAWWAETQPFDRSEDWDSV